MKRLMIGAVLFGSLNAWGGTPEQAQWEHPKDRMLVEGAPAKWLPSGPEGVRLLVPCGTGFEWGFDVEVTPPSRIVVGTGTRTFAALDGSVTMGGMVQFNGAGTYVVKAAGKPDLYVTTTCGR